MKSNWIILLLLVGILAACASPATEAPASTPTEEPAPTTEPSATLPPPTETSVPTLAPAETPTAAPAVDPNVAVTVSFAKDIFPLLKSRCGNCHGGNKTEEGLSIMSYADLMKGSESGAVIVPGNAEKSLLVEMIVSQDMPKRGPKLTPPQVQLIIDWVNQGALNN